MTLRSELVGMPERLGKYRIERLLGTGAFASVYLGVDDALAAPVAIKVLADNWSHDEDIRRRFMEEARILRRADDERIVRVHTVDELADGRPYFVMDYADRGTVHERLHEQGFTTGEAVHVARQIALALEVVHAMGYVHRDVKPTNVLFRSAPSHRRGGAAETVVLGDLGLAKASSTGDQPTVVGGTPAYMAPEQAVSGVELDGRADVYSLGVVLYEMLTGARPLPVKTVEDARQHIGTAPLRPSARRGPLPEALDRLVLSMLEPDVTKRLPSAAAAADALDVVLRGLDTSPPRVVADESVHDDPTVTSGAAPAAAAAAVPAAAAPAALAGSADVTVIGTPPGGARPRPSRRTLAVAGVVAAVLAIGGVAFAASGGGDDDSSPATTTAVAPSTTAATTSAAPATTVAPTTTAAPATTVPPTTTPAPAPTEAPAPVLPAAPAAALAASSTTVRVGEAVSLSSASSGAITAITWDFGDGTSGTGAEVSHAYAAPGTYTVRIVARGPGGSTSSSTSVVVRNALPTVSLDGPIALVRGQQGTWTPSVSGAVRGRWSWANAGCPITIGSPDWSPGSVFRATFNVQASCTLVLAVYNADDEIATARVSFVVS